MRRSGKSVMLELIQEELLTSGVANNQFISFNFEAMTNAHLCTAEALHAEIMQQAAAIDSKVYLFFDEIQEVVNWEKCVNSFRVELNCDMWNLLSIPFLIASLWNCILLFSRRLTRRNVSVLT